MTHKLRFLQRILYSIIFAWTLFIFSFSFHAVYENYQDAFESVLHEAEHGSQKDLSYRLWVSFHGGVYVPITKDTPPNPFLAHVPKRDIESKDGLLLTLVDPAYAMRQIWSHSSINWKIHFKP